MTTNPRDILEESTDRYLKALGVDLSGAELDPYQVQIEALRGLSRAGRREGEVHPVAALRHRALEEIAKRVSPQLVLSTPRTG